MFIFLLLNICVFNLDKTCSLFKIKVFTHACLGCQRQREYSE